MADYPDAITSFTTLVDSVDWVLASHQNERADEIVAIETELGINPKGSHADVVARLDDHDHSGGDGGIISYANLSNRRLLLPFGVYSAISPLTVTNSTPYAVSIDKTYTFVKWTQTYIVSTTNDGSNYWRIRLYDTASTNIAEVTTAAGSAGADTQISTTTFSPTSVGTANKQIFILVTKVGSPGSLFLYGPALEVEL